MNYLAERREEEKERRRSEIVDAALALYAEKGWDAVTMDQVARKARLSRALVYVYFRDKDDLLFAITARGFEELRERFIAAAAGQVLGADKVEAIGHAYVQFQRDLPHLFDACARFHAHDASGRDTQHVNEISCIACGDAVMEVLHGALRHGIADRSIRADIGDPNVVVMTLWAFTHGLIQIMTNKADAMALHGVTVEILSEQSFAMFRHMLGAPPKT